MMYTILLFIYCAICNSMIDKLQFHFSRSIFNSRYFTAQWWNPELSWKNHYKKDLKTEKFWGAKTVFVWLTDAWHFIENAMVCGFICTVLPYTVIIDLHNIWLCFLVNFLIYRFLFAAVEELFFAKVLNRYRFLS